MTNLSSRVRVEAGTVGAPAVAVLAVVVVLQFVAVVFDGAL
jgi:hypothetical protein